MSQHVVRNSIASARPSMRGNLRRTVTGENRPRLPLGSRLAERFARVGLIRPIPELRGRPPKDYDRIDVWKVKHGD